MSARCGKITLYFFFSHSYIRTDSLFVLTMYLRSLELIGFKSFAKKTALSFNTPITAIVGPNGSGKSNIAEAFRFVLGEQSMKSLRGKSSEDLIWNGGGDAGRANRAAVKITLDNSRRALALDFDEVTIERVVYRDSASEYLLNGSPVRLRDIIELLAGAHIGASGHHIISQGEADKILEVNPRDRREMIEDALGLKVYQYKRRESENKLEKTEENMKSVEGLRMEIAPHLRFLKKQVEKVEKAEAMRTTLASLYREYLKRETVYLAESARVIVDERRGPKEELIGLENARRAATKMLEESRGSDAKAKEVIAIEMKIAAARRAKDTLSREIGRIEGELASAERMAAKEREEGALAGHTATVPLQEVESLVGDIEREAA